MAIKNNLRGGSPHFPGSRRKHLEILQITANNWQTLRAGVGVGGWPTDERQQLRKFTQHSLGKIKMLFRRRKNPRQRPKIDVIVMTNQPQSWKSFLSNETAIHNGVWRRTFPAAHVRGGCTWFMCEYSPIESAFSSMPCTMGYFIKCCNRNSIFATVAKISA